ncbi:hypothetical protein [Adlercreutzia sp. DFI.6.23]|nr:hypothetical protein [Adlercreutzia sp. DFI.6.23]MCQ5072225.1 hypothetical protein [Adlercreutzia sp. DFI.6.23]
MSENEKTPTDAGTPVETEIAADEQTPDDEMKAKGERKVGRGGDAAKNGC